MVGNKTFNFFDSDPFGDGEKLLNSLNNHVEQLKVNLPKFTCKNFNYIENDYHKDENYYYLMNQNKVQTFLTIKGSEDPFTKLLIEKVNNNDNFYIIIHSEHESLDEKNFKDLDRVVREKGINQNKIFLINNGSNLKEYKEKYKSEFNIYTYNSLSRIKIIDMMRTDNINFKSNKNGKFFMTFNKEPKRHRYGLLCLLKKHNLLENTNWSTVPTFNNIRDENFYKPIFDDKTINFLKDEIQYFRDLEFKFSDFETDNIFSYRSVIDLTQIENGINYENTYVNLTTESVFDERENIVHITEKTYKPFFYYQFPLILASENHIKTVKEKYKLDLYEDVINYDYDNEVDDKKRLELYFKEVLRLYDIKEELKEFYVKNKNRFENNKIKIIEILSLIEDDYQYFYNLSTWKKRPLI
jgi:hypothetical protein